MADGAQEYRTDAPEDPDARVLALDIGLYGHRGALASFFWYRRGGGLHTHGAELLPDDATLTDQMDMVEAWAETYPEYPQVSPVVVIGVTVLSAVGKRQVRAQLDTWLNPPWRRRLVSIGDYATEHNGVRGLTSRKKLRDLLASRLTEHTIKLTSTQHDAVAEYSGRRSRPGMTEDDEWRADEIDAVALPVALACLAAAYLLPEPVPTTAQLRDQHERAVRAWQRQYGLDHREAADRAVRHGMPGAVDIAGLAAGGPAGAAHRPAGALAKPSPLNPPLGGLTGKAPR
jgi:hypothetical protein